MKEELFTSSTADQQRLNHRHDNITGEQKNNINTAAEKNTFNLTNPVNVRPTVKSRDIMKIRVFWVFHEVNNPIIQSSNLNLGLHCIISTSKNVQNM